MNKGCYKSYCTIDDGCTKTLRVIRDGNAWVENWCVSGIKHALRTYKKHNEQFYFFFNKIK